MYIYENCIVNDINSLFTNSKVCTIIANSLSEGFRRIAAKKEDEITLPAIVLTGGDWTLDDANFYSLMHGSKFKTVDDVDTNIYDDNDDETSVIKNMNIIPITPQYQMYVIARTSRECDMLTRELIFHYYMNPTLTIDIPYGIDKTHTFNLYFNSNVPKQENASGLVYRTLSFQIQGAYLWHNNTFNLIKKIDAKLKVKYDEMLLLDSFTIDSEHNSNETVPQQGIDWK